jgi:hypothetical protein
MTAEQKQCARQALTARLQALSARLAAGGALTATEFDEYLDLTALGFTASAAG